MESCEPWPLAASCLPDCWSVDPDSWTADQRRAVEAAYALLSKMIAGAYGLCTVTVRPCRQRKCRERFPYLWPIGASPWVPVLHDGKLYNITCGCMEQGECGCGPICEIKLDGPVHDVLEVKVDGQVIDPATYWIDNNDRLVRHGDYPCWPECQDVDLPDTEPDTWSVTYRRGVLPDVDGQIALTMLALATFDACAPGGKDCVLSERVTRVVREGIEIELDTIEEIRAGSTGIPYVDRWVGLVNPYRARLPMRAWSPDTVRGRRTTWTAPVAGGQL